MSRRSVKVFVFPTVAVCRRRRQCDVAGYDDVGVDGLGVGGVGGLRLLLRRLRQLVAAPAGRLRRRSDDKVSKNKGLFTRESDFALG